ncbi:MAG TPA: hypothetical protein VJ301_11730 [Propionibacteriaceae bacterium]|nr:hypothetical protein [Propionibacteriaceae bacterium]
MAALSVAKKIGIALLLVAAMAITASADYCRSRHMLINGEFVVCTTCCDGKNCFTTCTPQ